MSRRVGRRCGSAAVGWEIAGLIQAGPQARGAGSPWKRPLSSSCSVGDHSLRHEVVIFPPLPLTPAKMAQ